MEKDLKKEEETAKVRQIIIETDGNSIHLVKAEVSGEIELVAILKGLIGYIGTKNNGTKVNKGGDK